MLISPIPYQPHWRQEFLANAKLLKEAFGTTAIRIDHIGSTSVRGLVAKPVIDIQVTVKSLSVVSGLVENLAKYGYRYRSDVCEDRPPPWEEQLDEQWRKAYFKAISSENGQAQVHVREHGRRNQRYALLFRDYLRSSARSRNSYGTFKLRIAELVGHLSGPGGTGPYLDLKAPVFDLIADSAEKWAETNDWCVERLQLQ